MNRSDEPSESHSPAEPAVASTVPQTARAGIRHAVVYPIFLALFLVPCAVKDLASNLYWQELLPLMLIQAAIALLLLTAINLLLKDVRKAGVITTLLLVLVFNLGSLTTALKSVNPALLASVPSVATACVILLLFIAAAIFVTRSRSDFLMFTWVMNGVTLFLLIFNIAPIVSYELTSGPRYHRVAREVSGGGGNIEIKIPDDGSIGSPDIYYVILDCMGSSNVMRSVYDYDNSDYIKFLEKNNFYVAKQSHSNYDRTMLSLSSSLNLTHVTRLKEALGTQDASPRPCFEMITDNRIMSQLKRAGYQIVNVSSGFTPTYFLPNADINVGEWAGNRLYLAILQQGVLGVFEEEFKILGNLGRKTRTYLFDHFDEIDAIRGPKFVFAHILVPHPPFLFDEHGEGLPMPAEGMSEAYTRAKYLAQAQYMETHVRKLVGKLMKKKREVVMIIQGDHGPQITPLPDDTNPDTTYLKERFGIFNAYYGPPAFRKVLYPTITPVNSFRLLLNRQFRSDIKPLDDRSYYCERNKPFNFRDVTDELFDDTAAPEIEKTAPPLSAQNAANTKDAQKAANGSTSPPASPAKAKPVFPAIAAPKGAPSLAATTAKMAAKPAPAAKSKPSTKASRKKSGKKSRRRH